MVPKLLAVAMAVLSVGLGLSEQAAAEDPLLVPFTELLPGMSGPYDPYDSNDCKAGRIQCVDGVIREMTRQFDGLASDCDDNVMFSLAYLRTTEEYRRAVTTPGFFADPAFLNHYDVVFARFYFDAWDARYKHGNVPLPEAWRVAFQAAENRAVTGLGNAFLGMSAHINRDLAFVLDDIGLVSPEGVSRKADHDQVNEFLIRVVEPLLAEGARRFDPTFDDASIDGTTMDATQTMLTIQGWREQAWRNAERLSSAASPAERAAVAADIERTSAMEAQLIMAATSYSPVNAQAALQAAAALGASQARLDQASASRAYNDANGLLGSAFSSARAERDAYCAAHWDS